MKVTIAIVAQHDQPLTDELNRHFDSVTHEIYGYTVSNPVKSTREAAQLFDFMIELLTEHAPAGTGVRLLTITKE